MENGERIECGDFSVGKSEDGKFLSVSERETGFTVKYGAEMVMAHSIESLLEDEDGYEALEFLLQVIFVDCNTMWDVEYYRDRNEAIGAYIGRLRDRMIKTNPKDAMVVASLAGIAGN